MAKRPRKVSTHILTGDKELDAKLQKLKVGVANKYVRKGMTKALRLVVKAQKAQVPSQYKGAKRALGSRFDRKGKGGTIRARAGAGVAKKKEQLPPARSSGGVGIGVANIHWAILGTGERRRTKIGGFLSQTGGDLTTGRMPPIMPDIIKNGFNAAAGSAMVVIRQEIEAGIAIEAAK